ncbi:hypothetical protein DSOUD_1870 [Desulfuromonas soudanensis]|uniref:Uncharacterized protein n=1 Tax=Desulfuromonas soudanensis TaxID=1603606 RepID=A0A0M4D9K2_9BACT|nr:hypothetical protein [Desulfuromonas soudanensis]ALC16642.1 hypothetical protein DSOUD_1870 [Desulfuromonas soudanensis]
MVGYPEIEYMVEGNGYIEKVEDIEHVPVGADMKGTSILIRDIGMFYLGPDIRNGPQVRYTPKFCETSPLFVMADAREMTLSS